LSVSVADFFTFNFYELQFPQYLSAEATLPDGFSVAAVPELSTWAMLLIGFAAIGGCGIIHCADLTRLIRSSDSISSPARPNQKRILRSSTGDR
jgi:hypothetical protein